MFETLSSFQYTATPIKFSYLVPEKFIFNDFVDGSGVFQFQSALSGVTDFAINFDSINILTDSRDQFSHSDTSSSLAVYSEDIPYRECGEVPTACLNYWVTTPINAFTLSGDECIYDTNIVPLKNNFSETHSKTCTPCYRQYKTLNFGEDGLDNFNPEFIYTSNTRFQRNGVENFTFRLPDYSEPIPLSGDYYDVVTGGDVPDFICQGAIASDTPIYSDCITWMSGSHEVKTWLKGDQCSGQWVDGFKDDFLTDKPTELVLLSGVDYVYTRPVNRTSEVITELLQSSDKVVFVLTGLSGDTVIDGSQYSNNGTFV